MRYTFSKVTGELIEKIPRKRKKEGELTKKEQQDRFRATKVWKEFRKSFIENHDWKCEICGRRYPGKQSRSLQVHHKFPNEYQDLDFSKFSLLCSNDHDEVERWVRKIGSPKFKPGPEFMKWMIVLGKHLSEPVKSKAKKLYLELKEKGID